MVGGLGVFCSWEGRMPRRCRHSALASSAPNSAAHCVSSRGKEGMVVVTDGGILGAGSTL